MVKRKKHQRMPWPPERYTTTWDGPRNVAAVYDYGTLSQICVASGAWPINCENSALIARALNEWNRRIEPVKDEWRTRLADRKPLRD